MWCVGVAMQRLINTNGRVLRKTFVACTRGGSCTRQSACTSCADLYSAVVEYINETEGVKKTKVGWAMADEDWSRLVNNMKFMQTEPGEDLCPLCMSVVCHCNTNNIASDESHPKGAALCPRDMFSIR